MHEKFCYATSTQFNVWEATENNDDGACVRLVGVSQLSLIRLVWFLWMKSTVVFIRVAFATIHNGVVSGLVVVVVYLVKALFARMQYACARKPLRPIRWQKRLRQHATHASASWEYVYRMLVHNLHIMVGRWTLNFDIGLDVVKCVQYASQDSESEHHQIFIIATCHAQQTVYVTFFLLFDFGVSIFFGGYFHFIFYRPTCCVANATSSS